MGFAISVVSQLDGRSPDSIRRLERAGLIPKATRTPGGHRRWSIDDLDMILSLSLPRRPRASAEPQLETGQAKGDV